jgi:hypothetical protein
MSVDDDTHKPYTCTKILCSSLCGPPSSLRDTQSTRLRCRNLEVHHRRVVQKFLSRSFGPFGDSTAPLATLLLSKGGDAARNGRPQPAWLWWKATHRGGGRNTGILRREEGLRRESCCCVEIPLELSLKLLLKSFWLVLMVWEWRLTDGKENSDGNTYLTRE